MLLLNQCNAVRVQDMILGTTVLTCAITGNTFIAKSEGCTFNFAWNAAKRPVSDAGVNQDLRAQVAKRERMAAYIVGNTVQGWKSSMPLGQVVSGRVTYHARAVQIKHVTVRMFDGSLWFGKYGHLNSELCTLKPYKGQ